MTTPERFTVRAGSIIFTVFPWKHGSGAVHWRWKDEKGRHHSRKEPEAAKRDAKKMAELVRAGRKDLSKLPEDQLNAIHLMLDAGLNAELANEFLAWRKAKGSPKTLHEVIGEFLAAKENVRGLSTRNVSSLSSDLASLKAFFDPSKKIRDVHIADMDLWMATHREKSAKRRLNLRGSAVTLFRWCKRRRYLPDGVSAAEAIDRPKVQRGVPPTYEPEEAEKLIAACPAEYLPWLLLSGWAGLRYEEMFPPPKSDKRPFDWEDIRWDQDLIVVHPHTAKLGERRLIPLDPGVKALLQPLAKKSGRITPVRPPHKVLKNSGSINSMLGAHVGGWRPNGLRNSSISYRAAIVGLAKTAMEHGNSESECRKSYNDSKSEVQARAWYAVLENFRELGHRQRKTR